MSVRCLKQLVNENGKACGPFFHCAVCDVLLTTQCEWILHIKGQAHDVVATKVSCSENVRITELISKTKQFLGDQIEFVLEDPADCFKFNCTLCNVELNSYCALYEHVKKRQHELILKRRRGLESNIDFRERSTTESSNTPDMQTAEEGDLSHESEKDIMMDQRPTAVSHSDQDIAGAVSCLSRQFNGELSCKRCEQIVLLDVSPVRNHVQNCSAKAEESSVTDRFEQYAEQPSEDKVQVETTRPGASVIIGRLGSLQSSCVTAAAIAASSFECIVCDMTGAIGKWEDHLTKYHLHSSAQPKPIGFDVNCVACLCVMCNVLLFGARDRVASHGHFQLGIEYFALHAYPYLSSVLQPSAQLPRYYKFGWKLVEQALADGVSRLAFYCLACDYYGVQNAKKHFKSAEHKSKTHPMYELHFCDRCSVLFYCDRQLFDDHRQSPAHFLAAGHGDVAAAVVDQRHAALLTDLKKLLRTCWSEYQTMNHQQYLAYWCDPCGYRTHRRDDWRLHLSSDRHLAAASLADDYFEHPCVVCKLCLGAAARQHAAHFASAGHASIKSIVAHRYNQERLLQNRDVADDQRPTETLLDSVSVTRSTKPPNATKPKPAAAGVGAGGSSGIGTTDIDLDADPYTLRLDASHRDFEKKIRDFVMRVFSKHQDCVKRVKKFLCGFCEQYFSREHSWWVHLQGAEHVHNVSEFYATAKITKAMCLFCIQCMSLSLSAYVARSVHLKSKAHRQSCNRLAFGGKVDADDPKERSSSPTSTDEEEVGSRQNSSSDVHALANGDQHEANTEDGFSDEAKEEEQEGEDVDDELYKMIVLGDSDDDVERSSIDELENGIDDKSTAINSKAEDSTIEEVAENREIEYAIAVRGIPSQILKNKRLIYQTFSRYVVIKGTFTKKKEPGCLYIVVTKDLEESFKNLKKNVKTLKVKLGTDELTVEYATRNHDYLGIPVHLSSESKILFANKAELENGVHHLMMMYAKEANSPRSLQKIQHLEADVSRLATMIYRRSRVVKAHVFGSRVTGLATENSDVDIYLQIGNTFRGSMHDNSDLQRQLVVLFAKEMRRYSSEFRGITSIPFARVPIVKFTHVRSNLNCDLSFKSGLSTMNSILVKTYLELDNRIKFLVCTVKLWMKMNDLADRNLFTTYAQIWMVLFFLMQPDIAVVPTVIALKFMLPPDQQDFTVEGWNCSFPSIRNIIWRSSCTLTERELSLKFFEFYSDSSLIQYVLCTLTGIKIEKKHFECYESLPFVFKTFKMKMSSDRIQNRKVTGDFESLCIQDPFDHCHNLTKTINSRKFTCFVELCKQTVEILKK